MKTLICYALCAAIALGGVSAFADDDFGIESASPTTIADPVNPQPGMLFNAYGTRSSKAVENWLKDSHSKLPSVAAMKTGVDKSEKFSLDVASGVNVNAIRWEGFIKCKRAAAYTFTFQKKNHMRYFLNGYSVRINGRDVIPAAHTETSCDANLKVGWNKIEIVCRYADKEPLIVAFKPKGSVAEPRPITPKDLFHDQKPEEEW